MNELRYNQPFAEYLLADGVSKSLLDQINESPYRARVGQKETTDAMRIGTALHAQLFENRQDYVVQPETYGPEAKKWNGNATECKAWRQVNAGKTIISAEDKHMLDCACMAIRSHPHYCELTLGGFEVSMFAFDQGGAGVQLKGRADSLSIANDSGFAHVVDLKTTTDASTRAFSKEILSRRYHVQAAMYRRILRHLGFEQFTWTFIALEKGPVPLVNIRRLESQAIDLGEEQLDRDLELYKRCKLHNWWPHYSDQEEHIGTIDLPEFVYGDKDNLVGMTPAAI